MNPVICRLHLQESGGSCESLHFKPKFSRMPRHVSKGLSAYHDQPAPYGSFSLPMVCKQNIFHFLPQEVSFSHGFYFSYWWHSLHQGWYVLVGRLRLCFAGQPRNRWEMGQVLPSCLRNVARMEWFTSQTIDVVALLWGSSFCSWNLLRVVTYAQMRPTL